MASSDAACDRIYIRDLALHLRLGVTPEERAYPQRVLLSVELALDASTAGRSGRLEDTVDYSQLARELRVTAEGREWILVEQLLEHVAAIALQLPAAKFVTALLKKFVVPGTDYVAIEVTRRRTA